MSALKRAARFLALRTIAIAIIALAPPLAWAGDEAILAARDANAVAIVVSEHYEAKSSWTGTLRQQDLPYIKQPYGDLARHLFELAGVAVLDETNGVLVLRIEAHGTATATLYDTSIDGERIRETNYRAARVAGTIRLETAAGTIEHAFDGDVPAPYKFTIIFGYDLHRDPNNAPFREAFEAPGGYVEAIATLIREVYGEAVLLAALNDRDPLVRRAAELGLGQP